MLVSVPAVCDQRLELMNPSIAITHLPSNYANTTVRKEQRGRVVIGTQSTDGDIACVKTMLKNKDFFAHGGITRLDIICHSACWNNDLAKELVKCIPVNILVTTIRVTNPASSTEGITAIVHNRDNGTCQWASSFTSRIDSFDTNILNSLKNLETVELRPPSNPGSFNQLTAVAKLVAFFLNRRQSRAVTRLTLPMDILWGLLQITRASGDVQSLRTLELTASTSSNPNNMPVGFDILQIITDAMAVNCLYVKRLIFPLEWATAPIIQSLASKTALEYIRLEPLIGDRDRVRSVELAQKLLRESRVDFAALARSAKQRWDIPTNTTRILVI